MSISTAVTIGAVLALGLTIYAFISIIPEGKRAALPPLLQKLHDIFNLRSLLSEKILKALYVFNTFVCETVGFFLLFSRIEGLWRNVSTWWIGLLLILIGPFVCRLLHEMMMVYILMMKNTNEINQKLTVVCGKSSLSKSEETAEHTTAMKEDAAT